MEIQINKWYKADYELYCLYTGKNENYVGFSDNSWYNDIACYDDVNEHKYKWKLVDDDELKLLLIIEAKKRYEIKYQYKDINYESIIHTIKINDYSIYKDDNGLIGLLNNEHIVYFNGKWVQTI